MAKATGRTYYHLTFAPYRRIDAIWDDIEAEFYAAARETAKEWGFSILAMSAMPDHVHVLVEKAPWDQISKVVNLLKGGSSRRIGLRFREIKLDMHSDHFWSAGYHYERHDDASLATVIHYIENQKRQAGLEN